MNRSVWDAFRAAGRGLEHALRTQRNLRIQFAAAAAVLVAGAALGASGVEVAVLVAVCGLVLGLELVNTAVEAVADALWPHPCEVARRVKDTSAAAVVVAAAAAAAAGAVVLGPLLLARLGLAGGWLKPAAAVGGAGLALLAAGWRWVRRPASVEDGTRTVVE